MEWVQYGEGRSGRGIVLCTVKKKEQEKEEAEVENKEDPRLSKLRER